MFLKEIIFYCEVYYCNVKFFEKRRKAKKVYVFDLRSSEEFETSHLPGAHNLPFENFEDSIYQMPFSGEIMLYGSDEKELFSFMSSYKISGNKSCFINQYSQFSRGFRTVEAKYLYSAYWLISILQPTITF